MLSGPLWQCGFFLVCMVFSAFFSASETSLISITDVRARAMAENGERGAAAVQKATKDRTKLLAAILLGNNAANIAASSIATSFSISLSGNNAAVLTLTTVVVTIVILLFGEMIPKTIATGDPAKVAGVLATPINAVQVVLSPFTQALGVLAEAVSRVFGASGAVAAVTEAELKTMMTVSKEEGLIRHDEYEMIRNVFEFDESRARDVMTPRTDMAAVPEDAAYADVYRVFREEGYSRLPVYRGDLDRVVGVVNFKDFIFEADPDNFDIHAFLRQPMFSYENKMTSELFIEMRQSGNLIAVILDEYGGTSGLVTLEDLIEQIMGDITDEYDEEEIEISAIGAHAWRVDGATRLDDANEALGIGLASDACDTIGGYVMELIGAVPEAGASVESGGLRFTVEEMEKNRIATLRLETQWIEPEPDTDINAGVNES